MVIIRAARNIPARAPVKPESRKHLHAGLTLKPDSAFDAIALCKITIRATARQTCSNTSRARPVGYVCCGHATHRLCNRTRALARKRGIRLKCRRSLRLSQRHGQIRHAPIPSGDRAPTVIRPSPAGRARHGVQESLSLQRQSEVRGAGETESSSRLRPPSI